MTGACVAVAFSGGRDSTALLHATACAARDSGELAVVALHVHHGISPHADDWLRHAERLCSNWAAQGLPLRLMSRRIVLDMRAGESLEACARQARYAALTDMAKELGVDLVLLAHHRRDQAETLLLQAMRGAGVSGLAAMPKEVWREGICWARPWLTLPREAIQIYVARHELPYVEDDSNDDDRFARNRLRRQVWPVLMAAFPQAEASLAASALRVADALPGVSAWREGLLAALCPSDQPDQLDARAWAELSAPARRESLAHWYRRQTGQRLSASWINRLAQEVPALVFHQRASRWAELGLNLYRGVLAFAGSSVPALAQGQRFVDAAHANHLAVHATGLFAMPAWRGVLHVSLADEGGVSPALLQSIALRPRLGGEQFQLGAGRPPRSLKKQYQAVGVPAWCRQGPLLYAGEQLIFVPGLGVDARCQAQPGQPQWALNWVPEAC